MNEMIEMSKGGRSGGPQPVDPNEQISRKLRQFYDGVREQEIPDRFLDLLEMLDEAERKSEQQAAGIASEEGKK